MKIKNSIILSNIILMLIIIYIILFFINRKITEIYNSFNEFYLENISKTYAKSIDDYISSNNSLSISIESLLEKNIKDLNINILENLKNQLSNTHNMTIEDKNILLNNIDTLKNDDISKYNNLSLYNKIGMLDNEFKDNVLDSFNKIIKGKDNPITGLNLADIDGNILISSGVVLGKSIAYKNYFNFVIKNKTSYIEPIDIDLNNKKSFIKATPVFIDNEIIGIFIQITDIDNYIESHFTTTNLLSSGEISIYTSEKSIIYDPTKEQMKSQMQIEDFHNSRLFNNNIWTRGLNGFINYEDEDNYKINSYIYNIENIDWILVIKLYYNSTESTINEIIKYFRYIIIILIICFSTLNIYICNTLFKYFDYTINFIKKIKDGNLGINISNKKLINKNNEFSIINNNVNDIKDLLNKTVKELITINTNISKNSNILINDSSSLNNFYKNQESLINRIIFLIEEFSSNIKINEENISNTDLIILKTSKVIKKNEKAINDFVDLIISMNDKIQILQDVVNNINLLSLNATIEAARAGEFGKGFAVVAGEVSKLSERSNTSALQISDLIKNSLKKANESSDLFKEVIPEINKISNLMQNINNSSQIQYSDIKQISISIQNLNKNLKSIDSLKENIEPIGKNLKDDSTKLDTIVNNYNVY